MIKNNIKEQFSGTVTDKKRACLGYNQVIQLILFMQFYYKLCF